MGKKLNSKSVGKDKTWQKVEGKKKKQCYKFRLINILELWVCSPNWEISGIQKDNNYKCNIGFQTIKVVYFQKDDYGRDLGMQ